MSRATLTFHGIYPGSIREDGQTIVSRVLFNVLHGGRLHSHHIAHVTQVNGEQPPQVTSDFRLPCAGLADAVLAYLEYAYGPQSHSVSHGGPKGPNIQGNVLHVMWQTELEILDA